MIQGTIGGQFLMTNDPSSDCPCEQARKALLDSSSADPRQFVFGFFAADDFAFGPGAHHWYGSLAALHRALVHDLPFAFLDDEPEECAEFERELVLATEGMTTIEALGSVGAQTLAESLQGVQRLCWVGTFDELRLGSTEWALRMRSEFREHQCLESPATTSTELPLTDTELEEFIDFLAHYGT
jgi:hypothetical protein